MRIINSWHPILKMEWIDAHGLLRWLDANHTNAGLVVGLAEQFAAFTAAMETAGMAHGDLQHGNLLVDKRNGLRVIDYDGMYVPALKGLSATERGLANYQAPDRGDQHFGPYLDRFSAWVIYTALIAVAEQPTLWSLLRHRDDEKLLFDRADFADPTTSTALSVLRAEDNTRLSWIAHTITEIALGGIEQVPPLDVSALPLASPTTGSQPTAATSPTGLPSWVPSPTTEAIPRLSRHDGSWITDHLPQLDLATFVGTGVLATRIMCLLALLVAIGSSWLAAYLGLGIPGTAAAASASTLVGFFLFADQYLRNPTTRRRKAAKGRVKEARKITRQSKNAVEVIDKQQAQLELEQRRKGESLAGRRANAHRETQAKRDRIATTMQQGLQRIQAEHVKALGQINAERAQAQAAMAQQFVAQKLATTRISQQPPDGIGDKLASRLAYQGIRTAADFTGIELRSAGGRYNNTYAMIVKTNGQRVRVEGIGETKARSLAQWRQQHEQYARLAAPQLSPAQQRVFADKVRTQESQVTSYQAATTHMAEQQRSTVEAELIALMKKFEHEDRSYQQHMAQQRTQLAAELSRAEGELAKVQYSQTQAERAMAAFRSVGLTSYARYILTDR